MNAELRTWAYWTPFKPGDQNGPWVWKDATKTQQQTSSVSNTTFSRKRIGYHQQVHLDAGVENTILNPPQNATLQIISVPPTAQVMLDYEVFWTQSHYPIPIGAVLRLDFGFQFWVPPSIIGPSLLGLDYQSGVDIALFPGVENPPVRVDSWQLTRWAPFTTSLMTGAYRAFLKVLSPS